MIDAIKPLRIAFQGKGLAASARRLRSIGRRYGLTVRRMDRSLAELSRILQRFDCPATLPITAVVLARNGAVIRKYQAQGIEFAIHGYRHIDHSQLSLEAHRTQLGEAFRIFQDSRIACRGFRSPYLRWSEHTLAALGRAGLRYDSSPSLAWPLNGNHVTDSYGRVLRFFGAQPALDYPALPRWDAATGLVSLPYSLPDDESLVERLHWDSPDEMNQVWPAIFRQIHLRGELFVLGLHPERAGECSGALIATLQAARTAGEAVWCARLDEIADWWQARYTASVDIVDDQDNVLRLAVNGPTGTSLLLRALDVRTPTAPCFDGYRRALTLPCFVRTDVRPFIGVSPEAAPALVDFLKQQGYILEASVDAHRYPLYLDQATFSREDERPVLSRIEESDFPLARLGRWPNGARSALSVTGDIDALTLWDYGLRLLGK